MVIVFDLDDTLYEELSYVRSGYRAVAEFLSPLLGIDPQTIFNGLMAELAVGRNLVFDRFLQRCGAKRMALVKQCLSVYRGHEPKLELFPEARACLERLQNYPIYIVTDGNHLVQRRKFLALGLGSLVRRCFFTYAHGLHRRKPSPYCFEKICKLEGTNPSSVVYVADNPHKDFVGLNPLGYQTIRVLTGPYRNDVVEPCYDARLAISTLDDLNQQLLQTLTPQEIS